MKIGKLSLMLVFGIVAMLVFGYWAFVGFRTPIHDFTDDGTNTDTSDDSDSGDGGTTTAHYFAYGVFTVSTHIWDYKGWFDQGTHAKVTDITSSIHDYLAPSAGRVYEQTPGLQMDWGGEGGDSSGTQYPYYDVWVTVKIVGPSGYSSSWASEKIIVIPGLFGDSGADKSFDTGRAFFAVSGSYTISATIWTQLQDSTDAAWHSSAFTLEFPVTVIG